MVLSYTLVALLFVSATTIYTLDKDKYIFNILHNKRNKLFTSFFLLYTHLGSIWFITLLNTILFFSLLYKGYIAWAFFIPGITGICSISNTTLKHIFKRKRPDVKALTIEKSYSFPSGHSMGSSTFYTLIAFFISTLYQVHYIYIIAAIFVALIAYSRVYLGVHYPVDVLTGLGLGLLIAIIGIHFFPLFDLLETYILSFI